MSINVDETTVGTFPHRVTKAQPIVKQFNADWKVGGTYEVLFQTFIDSLNLVGGTATGDVSREHEIGQYIRQLFEKGQGMAQEICQGIKWALQELVKRHIARDAGQFDIGQDAPSPQLGPLSQPGVTPVPLLLDALLELYRQLNANSPKTTVKYLTVSLSQSAGSNVGNGVLILSSKRGDGKNAEHIRASKIRIMCVESGLDLGGIRNHELWKWQESTGPDGAHPNWMEGNRGRGVSGFLRTGDPSAFAYGISGIRGQLLRNTWENFDSNAPAYWANKSGTAGTDYQKGTAQAYFGSNCLEGIAGGADWELAQAFGSNAGTESEWEGNALYGSLIRLRPAGTITGGTLTWRLTDSSGNTLSDDNGTANSLAVTLSSLAAGAWTDQTLVIITPNNIARNAEIRVKVSGLTGANIYIDSGIVTKMSRFHDGGGHGAIVAGSTAFASNRRKALGDYFDVTGANNSAGASTPRSTWQRFLEAMLDSDIWDVLVPGTAGTAEWPDSALV